MPSTFVGGGEAIDYPAYLFQFTVTGSSSFNPDFLAGFFLANVNTQDGGALPPTAALGVVDESGLISTIASYLADNGWGGGTVSDLTVTKYTEASSDVTP